MGKSASGKDTLRKLFLDKGYKEAISYTTRPMREGEQEGVNYHYISMPKFEQLEKEEFFLESEKFREWKYGRSYESVEKGNIFIATVTGTANMVEKIGREHFCIVELICSDDTRKERSLKRGDDPKEVERRLSVDNADFSAPRNFSTDYVLYTDKDGVPEKFTEWYTSTNLMKLIEPVPEGLELGF